MPELGVSGFLASLLVIMLAAKAFGELAERFGQPAVLGELVGGVVLGSLPFFSPAPTLSLMAEFGVILLLFETGINSDMGRLLRAGPVSTAVAFAGVAAPFFLGWAFMTALDRGGMQAVFVGAALTATSVGITARVLSDMGRLNAPEAQIVLGAAVIDDIVGLVILAAVQGIALSGALSWWAVGKATLLSLSFLGGALWFGPALSGALVGLVKRMKARGVLIVAAVGFALAMALLAEKLGTALIVGAFTAGLLLAQTDKREDIDGALKPVSDLFVPIFFVMVGAKVRLGDLAGGDGFPLLAGGLLVAAVAGKLASGWAARGAGLNRWGIGFGMLPRGEVGLIFAQIGLASKVIDGPLYAAVVMVVVVTTFLAPPLLERSFRHG